MKNHLIRKGICSTETVVTATGRVKILTLTPIGVERAEEYGLEIQKRHGGVEHEYWKHELSRVLQEKGYTVELEHEIGEGRIADLFCVKEERRLFIEVETGKSDVEATTLKFKREDYGLVVIFFTSQDVLKRNKSLVTKNDPEKFLFLSPQDPFDL